MTAADHANTTWRCSFYGHEWEHFRDGERWGERCRRCRKVAYLW